MLAGTGLKREGMKALAERFGLAEAGRFIAHIIKEPFDYAEWHRSQFTGMSVREISNAAKKYCDETSTKTA